METDSVQTAQYTFNVELKRANEVAGNLKVRRIHHSSWGSGVIYDLFLWEELTEYGHQCRFAIGSADNASPESCDV